ncbi:MAG: transcription elongation factor GreA [Candidatus Gracilibacteria bacterium]|nr:transcription elongation factor GreA [Candidatus Gracilibacteria bacterium]
MTKKDDKKKKVIVNIVEEQIESEEVGSEDGKKVTLVTKEGLEKLTSELTYLKETRRREVAARIKEAISYGDLSENSEYEEAKNEQAFVEGRILELEEKVKNAKIITDRTKITKTVQIGSTVSLKNVTKKRDEPEVYTIVGSEEADPFDGKISNESPVGEALLDKKKGDRVRVVAPAGTIEYEIVKLD